MKKFLFLIFAVFLLVVLISCAEEDGNDIPDGEQPQEEETGGDDEAGEENMIVAPEIEAVEAAYHKAMEAFFWFHVCPMPGESYDMSDSATYIEADGMVYTRVNHDTIETYSDLECYLNTLFAGHIVAELLAIECYRDINDALYTIDVARGTDIFKGEETITVIQVNEGKFICTVEVELLDLPFDSEGFLDEDAITVVDYETHEFNYEYVDGKWIFTNFHIFR